MDARRLFLLITAAALAASVSVAQLTRETSRGRPMIQSANEGDGDTLVQGEGNTFIDESTVRTAREIASHSTGTPEWKIPPGFEKDAFVFARVIFKKGPMRYDPPNYNGRLGWWVDFPDADLNFSYRLQSLTSIRTDPDCRVIKLTDPTLTDFPLLYMEHVETLRFREVEVDILRRYLLNGGALLINDTWNDLSWRSFAAEMNRVLPGREWSELTTEHPIFHSVFELRGTMNSFQVPTSQFWNGPGSSGRGTALPLQWNDRGPGTENMHVRALLDDKGRLMVLMILNSDVSDGWEREGERADYFHTFSEKISYPLGVNMIFYLMTH